MQLCGRRTIVGLVVASLLLVGLYSLSGTSDALLFLFAFSPGVLLSVALWWALAPRPTVSRAWAFVLLTALANTIAATSLVWLAEDFTPQNLWRIDFAFGIAGMLGAALYAALFRFVLEAKAIDGINTLVITVAGGIASMIAMPMFVSDLPIAFAPTLLWWWLVTPAIYGALGHRTGFRRRNP